MENSYHHCYIINHMDEFLLEWSLCEYLQIDSYLSPLSRVSLYLSNFNTIAKYTSNSQKNLKENTENLEILQKILKSPEDLPLDISAYLSPDKKTFSIPISQNNLLIFPRFDSRKDPFSRGIFIVYLRRDFRRSSKCPQILRY